jgi:hypothetical protein
LIGCHKLKNLPWEFQELQFMVELDLPSWSQLGCLPDSIVHLSQLKTFRLIGCHKLKIYQWSWGSFKTWWNWTYQLAPN